MDGSPVLRQQSQNPVPRLKSEQNKISDSKTSKVSLHPVRHNLENRDPLKTVKVHPPHIQIGVSRLPVLAKSLQLQTPNEFTRSHSKYEEKPFAGKARTKKPCTRPVPFNLSQTKSSRVASENQHPNAIHSTRISKLSHNVCSSQIKTSKKSKHSDNLQEVKASLNTLHPLGQSTRPQKASATVSKPVVSTASAQENYASATETCSKNMNLLSLKDASLFTNNDFQPDHAALLSILQNKGVTSTMTSQSKPYNYLPQRVSVMKSCQKAEPNAGSMTSVTCSPDHGALQSIVRNDGVKVGGRSDRAPSIYTPMRVPIKKNAAERGIGLFALQSALQNEGVKTVGPECATPRTSVCPTGRSTSIYTAQRVPVKTNLAEPSSGRAARKQTPIQKWTPQRVTRHQSTSAMKLHTPQPSPYAVTSGFQSCKEDFSPKQKEVVQKLFNEENEESGEEEVTMPQTELPPDQTTCKMWGTGEDHLRKDEEQIVEPFIQNPERESVIVFSTSKKLFRAPCLKKPVVLDHRQDNPEDTFPGPLQNSQISATVENGTKDPLTLTNVINPAVAMLRKRLPLLEELRLDEEVATYTSVSVPMVSGFHTPRPRCGNPVATILHFEEATRFVPISSDLPPGSQLCS